MRKRNDKIIQRGATLIELLLYIAIVSIFSGFLTYSVVALINNYKRIQTRNDVLNNVSAVFSTMAEEIRSARLLYLPASVFGGGQGQVSLRTKRSVPDGEDWTYVDFYLDNQRVYLKREGVAAFPITSDRVSISWLEFVKIGTGTTTASIKVDLTIAPNMAASNPFYFTKNFSLTAGLR